MQAPFSIICAVQCPQVCASPLQPIWATDLSTLDEPRHIEPLGLALMQAAKVCWGRGLRRVYTAPFTNTALLTNSSLIAYGTPHGDTSSAMSSKQMQLRYKQEQHGIQSSRDSCSIRQYCSVHSGTLQSNFRTNGWTPERRSLNPRFLRPLPASSPGSSTHSFDTQLLPWNPSLKHQSLRFSV